MPDMTGETDLAQLIAAMDPALDPVIWGFATLPSGAARPEDLTPILELHEAEGATLILPWDQATAHGLAPVFPSRRITLQIHSSLDAVGFLARILPALAAKDIGVNPVSGYFHDHLFVPADRAEDAMAVLRALARDARP